MTVAAPHPVLQTLMAQDLLKTIVSNVKEVLEIQQTESTKRELIRANKRVAVEEIRSRRDLFLAYLERSFDERRTNFEQLFTTLDKALTSDTSQVGPILDSITTLAAKSPFADLSDIDLVKRSWNDPNHVHDV